MSDRRNAAERRLRRDRRTKDRKRLVGKRYAVIEITRSHLSLALLDRSAENECDPIVACREPWCDGSLLISSEEGIRSLGDSLQALAEKYHLAAAHVQIVLGGEYCITRTARGTSEEVRSQLQRIEQRSQLYLTLGAGEKIAVHRTVQLDARHDHALAAVCQKKLLDAIYLATTRAALEIESIEPALVAISRVTARLKDSPAESCLLLNLTDDAVELGVCHQGTLLLDYRPSGAARPEEIHELVSTHLSRLRRHVARQLPRETDPLERVLLCGDPEAVRVAQSSFEASKQFSVSLIRPGNVTASWEFAEADEREASIACLGALLSTYLPPAERNAPNFMEHLVAITREPLRPVLTRSAMPLAAVLLVALGVLSAGGLQQREINRLEQEINQLAEAQTRHREISLRTAALEQELSQLQEITAKIPVQHLAGVFARIASCMPSDVWLSSLQVDGLEHAQLAGASFLEAGVFDFAEWLQKSPQFGDVALKATREGRTASGPTIDFDIELNLLEPSAPAKEIASNE